MPRSHNLWRQRFQNERCKVTCLECGRVRHRCQLACPTSSVRSVVHRPVQQRSRRAASMRPVVARVPPQSYSAGNIKAILKFTHARVRECSSRGLEIAWVTTRLPAGLRSGVALLPRRIEPANVESRCRSPPFLLLLILCNPGPKCYRCHDC